MRQKLLAAAFAVVTLAGGTYLTATPAEAADLNCWNQATAIHLIISDFCGTEASCSFQCSSDFQNVTGMNCTCDQPQG